MNYDAMFIVLDLFKSSSVHNDQMNFEEKKTSSKK